MKSKYWMIAILAVTSSLTCWSSSDSVAAAAERVMWYAEPAKDWERQALPIGNGRLGAMVFGGVDRERIQFNEDSLWIGDEHDTGAYQAFGDIHVDLSGEADTASKNRLTGSVAEGYRRTLDLRRGVHRVEYRRDGTTYKRTYFASRPAEVLVFDFTADQPGAYSGRISLADAHRATTTATPGKLAIAGSLDGYVYSGGSTRGRKEPYDIVLQYEAQLRVLTDGGALSVDGDELVFTECNRVTLLLAADTDYCNDRERGWKGEHPHDRVTKQLEAAAAKSPDQLLAEHEADFTNLFDRCEVDWGETEAELSRQPTNKRLAAYREGSEDPDLEELVFQYARYLMISSSRPGCLPANLQGLWNQSNRPPWRSDYHTDVNIEMNYWFVDAANLSECFEPLAEWVHSIREVRREETKQVFHTRGWATHAENGVFGGSTWKWSKGDAAWVAQNLWDHYAFTRDKRYLRERAYPVLKELCEFWVDHLKELPDGRLVSPEGFSPEHGPVEDGVSFDQQLVWDLFTNYIEASEQLEADEPFRNEIRSMRQRLLGPQIGRWGQLQEWMVDRDDPKDKHRHLSHMIAVYPGRQIAPETTPELAEAARVSLNARGDEGPGWSRAWKICLWARLHDGNRAYQVLRNMLAIRFHDNLLNVHPPFQIDGNFGYAAGVCEMLVQSHLGKVEYAPALPDKWKSGSVKGMRVRGGATTDFQWRDGRVTVHATKP